MNTPFDFLTGDLIRAGRAMARVGQIDLARRSGLSLEMIRRLERLRGPVVGDARTLAALGEAFRLLGITFPREAGGRVGVRLNASTDPPRTPESSPPSPALSSRRLYRLIYFSTALPHVAAAMNTALGDILEVSRPRNARSGITGALLACDGRFLQLLEGDKAAVQDVYGSIAMDARHASLHVVESGPAASREFADWSLLGALLAGDEPVIAEEPGMDAGFRPETLSSASAVRLLATLRTIERGGAAWA